MTIITILTPPREDERKLRRVDRGGFGGGRHNIMPTYILRAVVVISIITTINHLGVGGWGVVIYMDGYAHVVEACQGGFDMTLG